MLVFEPPRTVDDFYAARLKKRTGVARTERSEHRHLSGEIAVDVPKTEASINAQTRLQVIRPQYVVRIVRDCFAEGTDARREHRETRSLLMATEAAQVRRAVFQRRQYVESTDAAARPVRQLAVFGYDDNGTVEVLDQLGRDNPDDTPMPAFGGNDENAPGTHGWIGFDDLLRAREDRGLFVLPPQVFAVQLPCQIHRFCRHRFIGCEQQSGRDIRARHASGSVHTRRNLKCDVAAVDGLAGQSRDLEQRP